MKSQNIEGDTIQMQSIPGNIADLTSHVDQHKSRSSKIQTKQAICEGQKPHVTRGDFTLLFFFLYFLLERNIKLIFFLLFLKSDLQKRDPHPLGLDSHSQASTRHALVHDCASSLPQVSTYTLVIRNKWQLVVYASIISAA